MAPPTEKTAFQRILDRAEQQFGSKQDTAKAIGIGPQRYSKVYAGRDYGLSVENCLRLALVTGESPATVLTAMRKAPIAELLEKLYGQRAATISPELATELQDETKQQQALAFLRLNPLMQEALSQYRQPPRRQESPGVSTLGQREAGGEKHQKRGRARSGGGGKR
jgi:hypothetical protein